MLLSGSFDLHLLLVICEEGAQPGSFRDNQFHCSLLFHIYFILHFTFYLHQINSFISLFHCNPFNLKLFTFSIPFCISIPLEVTSYSHLDYSIEASNIKIQKITYKILAISEIVISIQSRNTPYSQVT